MKLLLIFCTAAAGGGGTKGDTTSFLLWIQFSFLACEAVRRSSASGAVARRFFSCVLLWAWIGRKVVSSSSSVFFPPAAHDVNSCSFLPEQFDSFGEAVWLFLFTLLRRKLPDAKRPSQVNAFMNFPPLFPPLFICSFITSHWEVIKCKYCSFSQVSLLDLNISFSDLDTQHFYTNISTFCFFRWKKNVLVSLCV